MPIADSFLESRHSCARMSTTQHHPHAALAIHAGGRGPIYFIGADDAAAATGEFVADTAVLIGVIAHLQKHTRLQHKHWHSRRSPVEACILDNVAGVDDLRNLLSRRRFAGYRSDLAHR